MYYCWVILAATVTLTLASSELFAFGSCSQFYKTHPLDIFLRIARERPSYFIFLGDMLYLDQYVFPGPPTVWRPLTS